METLLLKNEPDIRKISLADLLYISYCDKCIALFMRDEIILIEGFLADLKSKLSEQFVSLNKHTIVNLNTIQKMSPAGRRTLIENSRGQQISVKQLTFLYKVLGMDNHTFN